MGLVDWILNLTAVLLWFNWRSQQLFARFRSSPLSLVSTLKKPELPWASRWLPLAGLLTLLVVRSLFYWNVGAVAHWTPSLQLGIISLPFRSDQLPRMLLFSFLGFGLVLAGVYAWLLLISVINRRVPSDEPVQRWVRLHLGWVERFPAVIKLLLPLTLAALCWGLGNPLLVTLGILPPPSSKGHLWEQAVVLGLSSILAWKLLVLGLCLLYLINSYIYFGDSLFWRFIHITGANLLHPLRRLPLNIGKVDLTPLLVVVLVLVLAHWVGLWLPRLYQRLPF